MNKIGETIAYPSDNKEAEYDISFLLLYIACQLVEHDSSNRKDYLDNIKFESADHKKLFAEFKLDV